MDKMLRKTGQIQKSALIVPLTSYFLKMSRMNCIY
jgi:hypothetical protein